MRGATSRPGSEMQDTDQVANSYQDWYHGFLMAREAEEVLKNRPPGSFIVRTEITKQLIITYRASPKKVKHILVPDKTSAFYNNSLGLCDVRDVVNHIVHHLSCLSRPVRPEKEHPPPNLARHLERSNKDGLPAGVCFVCEDTVPGPTITLCKHKRYHRIEMCPLCQTVMMHFNYAKHVAGCQGKPNLKVTGAEKNSMNTFSRQPRTQRRVEAAQGQKMVGRLTITIVEARLTENFGVTRMDPYARLRIGHNVYETPTCQNEVKEPKWDETVNCDLMAGTKTINLELLNKCSDFTGVDNMIAHGSIPLPEIMTATGERVDDWWPLSARVGAEQVGSVHLIMSLQHHHETQNTLHSNTDMVNNNVEVDKQLTAEEIPLVDGNDNTPAVDTDTPEPRPASSPPQSSEPVNIQQRPLPSRPAELGHSSSSSNPADPILPTPGSPSTPPPPLPKKQLPSTADLQPLDIDPPIQSLASGGSPSKQSSNTNKVKQKTRKKNDEPCLRVRKFGRKTSKFNVKVELTRLQTKKKKTKIKHHKQCSICKRDTDLLTKCSSCPLVYHRNCLPSERRPESDDWSCPQCQLQGVIWTCSECNDFSSKYYTSYCNHIRKYCRGNIPQFTRQHLCELANMSRYSNASLAGWLLYVRKNVLGPRYFSHGVKKVGNHIIL